MVEKPSSFIFSAPYLWLQVISLGTKIVKECKVHLFSSVQGDHMRVRQTDDHPCKSEIRPVVFKGEEENKNRKENETNGFL